MTLTLLVLPPGSDPEACPFCFWAQDTQPPKAGEWLPLTLSSVLATWEVALLWVSLPIVLVPENSVRPGKQPRGRCSLWVSVRVSRSRLRSQ